MFGRRHLAFAATCVALALPAQAGLFDDEEARKQIAQLRTTVDALSKRLDESVHNQLDLHNHAETLKADVARLVGQIEVLANSLESAHKRQQDFYVDLDNRLRKLEGTAIPAEAGAAGDADAAAAAAPKADPQAAMRDYDAALGQLRAGKFKEAQASFESFIARHAKSDLLPNAHYWLGSSLHQQRIFIKAAEVFGKVPALWPNDPKAPDALLAQGNALVEAKNPAGAAKAYQTVVEKYPASPAAATARERLKTLAPKKPA